MLVVRSGPCAALAARPQAERTRPRVNVVVNRTMMAAKRRVRVVVMSITPCAGGGPGIHRSRWFPFPRQFRLVRGYRTFLTPLSRRVRIASQRRHGAPLYVGRSVHTSASRCDAVEMRQVYEQAYEQAYGRTYAQTMGRDGTRPHGRAAPGWQWMSGALRRARAKPQSSRVAASLKRASSLGSSNSTPSRWVFARCAVKTRHSPALPVKPV